MKKIIILTLCFLLCATFVSASGSSEKKGEKAILGSSGLGGSWFPAASAIAEAVGQYTDSEIKVQATGGGIENLKLMAENKVQLGLAETNIMTYAYQGKSPFSGAGFDRLRSVANLYPLVFQATVHSSSRFMTFRDLCDASGSFSPGAAGSGDEISWKEILEGAFGRSIEKLNIKPLSYNDRVLEYQNGSIDCIGYETPVPAGTVLEASAQNPLRLLEIGGAEREELMKKYPWYSTWSIPAGTYNGQESDCPTVVIGSVLVADAENASEKIVYDLVSTLYGQGLRQIQSVHSFTPYIKLGTALDGIGSVPLHPGAEKFYREKGLIK